MIAQLQILFDSPTANDAASLMSVARQLTNDSQSVRVFPRKNAPDWLVAEFTMPTEAQHKAVDKIDRSRRFSVSNRVDSIISFPKSEQERRRARHKAERRRLARRKAPSPKPDSEALRKPNAERIVGREVR
jgi:hypothetical protein